MRGRVTYNFDISHDRFVVKADDTDLIKLEALKVAGKLLIKAPKSRAFVIIILSSEKSAQRIRRI